MPFLKKKTLPKKDTVWTMMEPSSSVTATTTTTAEARSGGGLDHSSNSGSGNVKQRRGIAARRKAQKRTTTTARKKNRGQGGRDYDDDDDGKGRGYNILKCALNGKAMISDKVMIILALMLMIVLIVVTYALQIFVETVSSGGDMMDYGKRLHRSISSDGDVVVDVDNSNRDDQNRNNINKKEELMIQTKSSPFDNDINTYYRNKKEYIDELIRKVPSSSNDNAFIIFDDLGGGQGAGNVMAGLLSAHLLGFEFNRTVCVTPDYVEFHMVFEHIDPIAVKQCPTLFEKKQRQSSSSSSHKRLRSNNNKQHRTGDISLVNFGNPPDECWLKTTLLDIQNKPILRMVGNTYPRWPKVPEGNFFFFRYYRAKQNLLSILPYNINTPPQIVIHLRSPDSAKIDPRKGLDDQSLNALGQMLSSSSDPTTTTTTTKIATTPYLVTNRVAWYDMFEKEYNWSHPNWNEVVHSALKKSWGRRQQVISNKNGVRPPIDHEQQNIQLWADWYTILTAKTVYHTHSDFSISAIHWMNIDSKTIKGYNTNTGKLDMIDESWRIDGETPRLVDRTIKIETTTTPEEEEEERKTGRHRKRHNHREIEEEDDDDKGNLRLCNKYTTKTLQQKILDVQ